MTVDWQGVALAIAATGTAIATIIAAYAKLRSDLEQIKRDTAPTNGKPIPRIIEEAESRRISRIPPENRTPEEHAHLATIPPPERPGRDASSGPTVGGVS